MRILQKFFYARHRSFRIITLLFIMAAIPLTIFILLRQQELHNHAAGAVAADVTVTIDTSTPMGNSNFIPGISQVDNSLRYPWGTNDQGAVNSAKSLISNGIPMMNQHIMAWGVADIWPDPTTTAPTNWQALDGQMQVLLDTKTTPVITLAEAPWWMKGQLQKDGTTKLIPDANGEWSAHTYSSSFTDYRGITYPAGYVSPDPYSARIVDNQMNNWLKLVQLVAQRYMVAPYNVRYFQVWNELKGYYDPITNQYDYTTNAGDTTGYNAKHGYTYMYNQAYTVLMQTATSLGIPASSIQVGGPYVVMDTWASTNAGGFPTSESALQGKAYGTYDRRPTDVVKYWLQNKAGAGFITIDGNDKNKDSTNLTDPFTASEKFADVTKWIRTLDNTTYPGAQTLPIWWAEWYASPYTNITDDNNNAVKTYAMMELLKAGGAVPLAWGGTGDNITNAPGMWTPTTAGGGQALPWYTSYKSFHDYFSPGTQLFTTMISSPSAVDAVASALHTMLVNKTANVLTVSVNGTFMTLNPYQVTIVDTLSPTPTITVSATPVPTSMPTDTPIPTDTPTIIPTVIPTLTPTTTPVPPTSTKIPLPTSTPTVVPDTTSPRVSITKPLNGSTVLRKQTITISADATDNVRVTQVKFYANSGVLCVDTTAPYSCSWSVPAKSNSKYTIQATAYDPAGNYATATISVIAK